jgi:hypothetical protein
MSKEIELLNVSNANTPVLYYIRKCPECRETALIVPSGRIALDKVKRRVKCEVCKFEGTLKFERRSK